MISKTAENIAKHSQPSCDRRPIYDTVCVRYFVGFCIAIRNFATIEQSAAELWPKASYGPRQSSQYGSHLEFKFRLHGS